MKRRNFLRNLGFTGGIFALPTVMSESNAATFEKENELVVEKELSRNYKKQYKDLKKMFTAQSHKLLNVDYENEILLNRISQYNLKLKSEVYYQKKEKKKIEKERIKNHSMRRDLAFIIDNIYRYVESAKDSGSDLHKSNQENILHNCQCLIYKYEFHL